VTCGTWIVTFVLKRAAPETGELVHAVTHV